MDETIAIPHVRPVESLNAGVAASIMLYEAARQSIYVLDSLGTSPTPPADGRWVDRDDLASLRLAEPHHRPPIDEWFGSRCGPARV